MKQQTTIKSDQKTGKRSLFSVIAFILLSLSVTTQASGIDGFTPSFGPNYYGSYSQKSQHMQHLQIQIATMERYINMIEYRYKFVRFSRQDLITYRNWIYSLRMQQSQMKLQLTQARIAQFRR